VPIARWREHHQLGRIIHEPGAQAGIAEVVSMKSDAPLLEGVLAELFQSEKSASRHPLVEADRLGDSPPSLPMQLVAAHATRALSELDVLAVERKVEVGVAAMGIGRGLSAIRNRFGDLPLRREQSYRMTLLGIRHGIDLVRLLREIAIAHDDSALMQWADQWLEERLQLIGQAEAQLAWFARKPEQAVQPVKNTIWARGARSLSVAFGKLDGALSRRRASAT
jgi:hypothetical protein